MAIIPKNQNSIGLEDSRPKSVIGCIYKIISKIIANRMKRELPKIIDFSQSTFLKG